MCGSKIGALGDCEVDRLLQVVIQRRDSVKDVCRQEVAPPPVTFGTNVFCYSNKYFFKNGQNTFSIEQIHFQIASCDSEETVQGGEVQVRSCHKFLKMHFFQFGQIHSALWTNTFGNLDKYIFKLHLQLPCDSVEIVYLYLLISR